MSVRISRVRLSLVDSPTNLSPSPPVVDCGRLTASLPLQVMVINTTFNSTANYSCQVGYNLVGTAERTCQANGSYSGVEPSCMSELLEK